ncbi:(d)CMP kinase [bacterium]|jgi:cytidylate kinase|nr:(d)CMP kinase [bacterium]NBS51072.1 (d)CMP kinase [Spartobacteria bacterium]
MTIIAIDGPAASGKSSVSKRLARRLGFSYVNSGSMYRAVTWELLRQSVDPLNPDSVRTSLDSMELGCGFTPEGESFIRINAQVPDAELKESVVNNNVSTVSAIPAVRHLIVARLRALVNERDVVMEGRDIGSAVFPDAPHKFYLDASPEIRRLRRAAEGQTDSIDLRDKQDSSRAEAPLQVAKGACVVDTSHLTLDGVVEKISQLLAVAGLHPR